MDTPRIRWMRILVGGLLAEVAVFAVVIPVNLFVGQHALLYVVPPACLVASFLFAMWVGRALGSRFVLHGALVGLVAVLLYVAMTLAGPEPVAYLLANGLKILGRAGGRLKLAAHGSCQRPGRPPPMPGTSATRTSRRMTSR